VLLDAGERLNLSCEGLYNFQIFFEGDWGCDCAFGAVHDYKTEAFEGIFCLRKRNYFKFGIKLKSKAKNKLWTKLNNIQSGKSLELK